MLVKVVGFRSVGGKRKSDGADWSAIDLHYICDPDQEGHVGMVARSEFISSDFEKDLRSSGLGTYEIEFSRGYNGKAYITKLNFIEKSK